VERIEEGDTIGAAVDRPSRTDHHGFGRSAMANRFHQANK
jgi:hypothetical protein